MGKGRHAGMQPKHSYDGVTQKAELSRLLALLMLLVTVVPIVYILALLLAWASVSVSNVEWPPEMVEILPLLHLVIIVWTCLLLALYVAILRMHTGISRGTRLLWTVALLCLGPLTMLVYWHLHIWPRRAASAPADAPTHGPRLYQALPDGSRPGKER